MTKVVKPFTEGRMPKNPEMSTKQLTPIMEKDSMSILAEVLMWHKSARCILSGNGKVAPVKCTISIINILMMRKSSKLLWRILNSIVIVCE